VVSSATMDAETFAEYFRSGGGSVDEPPLTVALLSVEGRTFPVGPFSSGRRRSSFCRRATLTMVPLRFR